MTTGYDSLNLEFAEMQDPMGATLNPWTSRTSHLWRASITRGRQSLTDAFDAGSMTIVMRQDSLFTTILPGTPVRLSARDSTNTIRYLFTGFVSPQRSPYEFVGMTGSNVVGTVTIQCVDLLSVLAAHKLDKLTTAAYGGQAAGAAIAALDSAYTLFPGWQTEDLDDGQTILIDTPLGEDALAVIQKMVSSDGITAACYADRNGNFVFDDAYSVLFTSRIANSQQVFDYTGSLGVKYARHLHALLPLRPYTKALFRRLTSISIPENTWTEDIQSGEASSFTDVFGLLTAPTVTILGEDTNVNKSRASFYADVTANQLSAITGIDVYPRRDSTTLDAAIKRELRDRVTVITPFGTSDCWVDRIGHEIDAKTKAWTCSLGFTDRGAFTRAWGDPDLGVSPLILDDATNGKLDQSDVLLGF